MTDGGVGVDADLDLDLDADHGAPGDDGEDDSVEPVEVLVQLAEDGEIDPWDIDIVAVTDAFLDRLERTDLRTSGRALFYASVLLRMKSDELLDDGDDEAEEPAPEPWERRLEDGAAMGAPADATDGDGPPAFDPVDALESELDRRLERRDARGSPETLDELVRELREAERGSWWKESRTYDTDDRPARPRSRSQTVDYRAPGAEPETADEPTAAEVTERTHAEDVDAMVDDVREAVAAHHDAGRDEVLFAEVRDAAGDPVDTYLGVLFLSHRGVVRLVQDELFGDLWIRPGDAGDTRT